VDNFSTGAQLWTTSGRDATPGRTPRRPPHRWLPWNQRHRRHPTLATAARTSL